MRGRKNKGVSYILYDMVKVNGTWQIKSAEEQIFRSRREVMNRRTRPKKIVEAGIKADEILYSPLLRAADTAKHISEMTGIPAHMEPRLIEQNFGIWEGTSPRNSAEFLEAKKEFLNRYGNGESMFQVAHRIYGILDELKAQQDKTYILVAHNGIARVVKSYFSDMTNEEYAAFGVQNCSVTEFSFEEK